MKQRADWVSWSFYIVLGGILGVVLGIKGRGGLNISGRLDYLAGCALLGGGLLCLWECARCQSLTKSSTALPAGLLLLSSL